MVIITRVNKINRYIAEIINVKIKLGEYKGH